MREYLKNLGLAFAIAAVLIAGISAPRYFLLAVPEKPKNTQHLSPLFCFNNYGEEHLSDVCSKVGKTWPV